MSLKELTEAALALPKVDRIHLAQNLWESIADQDLPIYTEQELDKELSSRLRDEPNEDWKTHEQVMTEGRRKFGCYMALKSSVAKKSRGFCAAAARRADSVDSIDNPGR